MLFSTPQPTEAAKSEVSSSQPQGCPVCGGYLVDLHGQARCSRCHFTFCVGCDNAQATTGCDTEYD